jgi:tetratricopeptide (TPR) repeat protein
LEASILREINRNDPQLPQILHYYDVAINLLCKEGYVNSPLEKRDEMNDFKDHNIPSHLFLDRAKTFLMF